MALFKKKEDLSIPRIPSLPEFRPESRDRELPSLPRGFNEDTNRSIIKSALIDNSEIEDSEMGAIPSPPRTDFGVEPEHERFLPQERSPYPTSPPELLRRDVRGMEGPDSIFVRMDKFRAAKKELADIKRGLLEAEAIINKIHEIKVKEDNEVRDINLNLDNIKKKIGEVDSLVFDKF